MCEALAPFVLFDVHGHGAQTDSAGPLIQRNAVAKQGNLYFVQVLLAVAVRPPQLGIVDLDLNRRVLLQRLASIRSSDLYGVGISLAALFAGMTAGNVL